MAKVQQNAFHPLVTKPGQSGQLHKTVGLFAGIGALERGLGRAGHETALLCENDPAAKAVLAARFPGVPVRGDVRELQSLPRATTLLAAGFPCQDLSQAGNTSGINGPRSGLVGEIFRLIARQEVPWLLLENVPFMLQLGHGEAMNVIVTALESLRYRWAYRVVDTRSFGLPQRRRRVYIVASLHDDPRRVLFADESSETPDATNTNAAKGFYWTEGSRGLGWAIDAVPTLKGGSSLGIPSAPAILLSSGEIVTPEIRDAERLQGLPVDWTKPAETVVKPGGRWKLVGNAVSVPAAAWIGRRLSSPGAPLQFDTREFQTNRQWPAAAWNIGNGRERVLASEWPVRRQRSALEGFLRFPTTPLSEKATAGFLSRAEKAKLRFEPGFLDAVREHLERMKTRTNKLPRSARPTKGSN